MDRAPQTNSGMSRREKILALRKEAPCLLPSVLFCDFSDLRGELCRLESAGIRGLHLDVMDGSFVPNFTFGMPLVAAMRHVTELPLDVHLMMVHPWKYLEEFAQAGADSLTVHIEAVPDAPQVLRQIRDLGLAAGVALNPNTALTDLEPCVGSADIVLVMSVEAGFGGQSFRHSTLEKARQARRMFGDGVVVEMDGGINATTIRDCVEAGAEWLVVGSAIIRTDDYGSAYRELRQLAGSATQSFKGN